MLGQRGEKLGLEQLGGPLILSRWRHVLLHGFSVSNRQHTLFVRKCPKKAGRMMDSTMTDYAASTPDTPCTVPQRPSFMRPWLSFTLVFLFLLFMTVTCPHCKRDFARSLATHARYCKARQALAQEAVEAHPEDEEESYASDSDSVPSFFLGSPEGIRKVNRATPPAGREPSAEVRDLLYLPMEFSGRCANKVACIASRESAPSGYFFFSFLLYNIFFTRIVTGYTWDSARAIASSACTVSLTRENTFLHPFWARAEGP